MNGIFLRITVTSTQLALFLGLVFSSSALACGWWGDGEMQREDDVTIYGEGGESDTGPIPAGIEAARLPGDAGYGIAVFRPDMAIPFLRATNGRKLTRIGQLQETGFVAVVDLGTPPGTASLHGAETGLLGMRYVNIPVQDDIPTAAHVARFTETVNDAANRPLVVYAPGPSLLGNMRVLHRLRLGAPRGVALGEGMAFGASRELEEFLAGQ